MKKSLLFLSTILATLVFFATPLSVKAATYPEIQDVTPDGTPGNQSANRDAVSDDARYVAFTSTADNLVTGVTPGSDLQIFLHDRQTSSTTLISKAPDGSQGNAGSYEVVMSPDGRYIAFVSGASNLVPNDTNNSNDIFLWDRQTGTVQLLYVGNGATQPGDNGIENLVMSADARYFVFSGAANLDPNYQHPNSYSLYDRQTGITKVFHPFEEGSSYNGVLDITPNGRYITYSSSYHNYIYDQQTGTSQLAGIPDQGASMSVSADGRYIAYNKFSFTPTFHGDVLVYDRQTGQTETVNKADDGTPGNSFSVIPNISNDGRYVTFLSSADNLVPNDTNAVQDAFIYDRQTDKIKRVSVNSAGEEHNGNGIGYMVKITGDNHYLVFETTASNLSPNNSSEINHVYVTTNPFDPPVTNHAPSLGSVTVTPSPAHINTTTSASASFTDPDTTDTHTATIDWGDGSATQSANVTEASGSGTASGTHTYTTFGTYTVTVTVKDAANATGSNTGSITVVKQITTVSPASLYFSGALLGLLRMNLRAEVYKDNTLVTSGVLNNVNPGTNATLETITFGSFSPVDFPAGSALKIKVLACRVNTLGTITFHYNAANADSRFGSTIGTTSSTYHLRSGSVLATSAGASAQTATTQTNCSTGFGTLGTWTVTP